MISIRVKLSKVLLEKIFLFVLGKKKVCIEVKYYLLGTCCTSFAFNFTFSQCLQSEQHYLLYFQILRHGVSVIITAPALQ